LETLETRGGFRDVLTVQWLPFWMAFAAALAFRLFQLGDRPLHHDEGVNAWFLYKILTGYQFNYDPDKFHGPFLFFFEVPFAAVLGVGDLALRLPNALLSAGMVPLLLPLRRRLGVAGVTAAAWLLALSPSLVSYGRDLIHETSLAFFSLALVVAVLLYLETRRQKHLVLAALSLGLLATIKETYVLTLAVLAIAAVMARIWAYGRPRLGLLWGRPALEASIWRWWRSPSPTSFCIPPSSPTPMGSRIRSAPSSSGPARGSRGRSTPSPGTTSPVCFSPSRR